MPCDLPSIDSASAEALIPDKMAARVAAGPGFWTDWLSDLSLVISLVPEICYVPGLPMMVQ